MIEYNLSYTQLRTKATKPFNQNPHPIQSISKTWRGITNAGQVVRQAIQLVEEVTREDPGVVWGRTMWDQVQRDRHLDPEGWLEAMEKLNGKPLKLVYFDNGDIGAEVDKESRPSGGQPFAWAWSSLRSATSPLSPLLRVLIY